jgi:acyl carrier protein
LRTGDLGFLHAGELFIVGRMKDLLIVNGENYFPEDLEQHVAAAHEAALEGVAIFAVETGEREQLVLLLERRRVWQQATLAEQRRALADSAQRTVAQATGLWVDAVGLVAPGHLPRTTSGKIQRFRCRERFLAAQTEGIEVILYPQPAQTLVSLAEQIQAVTPVSNFILAFLAQRLQCPIAELDLRQSIRDLGVGSLDIALLLAQLADQFGIHVPLEWFLENLLLEEFLARVNAS